MHYTKLYFTLLYYIRLYYIIFYCTILDSTVVPRRPPHATSNKNGGRSSLWKAVLPRNAPIQIQVRIQLVRLCDCLSVCLFVRSSVCWFVCLFVQCQKLIQIAFSFVLESGHLFVCLFVCVCVCLLFSLFVCLSVQS